MNRPGSDTSSSMPTAPSTPTRACSARVPAPVSSRMVPVRRGQLVLVTPIWWSSLLRSSSLCYDIRSKHESLWEILRRYTEYALRGAEAIAAADLDPLDKLRELIGFHVGIIAEHRQAVAIQVRDSGALTGARAAELQILRDKVQGCWQRVLDDGYQAGRFRSADRAVVNGLLGMVNVLYLWYRPEKGDTVESIADQFCAMALDGLVR
jgi:hypothetical protein